MDFWTKCILSIDQYFHKLHFLMVGHFYLVLYKTKIALGIALIFVLPTNIAIN